MTANAFVWRGLVALRPRLPEDRLARALAAASLIDWIGTGIWLTVSTLFFVRVVGLRPAAIGAGFGIAGVVGLLAVMPVASLTRRWPAGPPSSWPPGSSDAPCGAPRRSRRRRRLPARRPAPCGCSRETGASPR